MTGKLNGNMKWVMGIVAALFTSLVLGFSTHLEQRGGSNEKRITAIEKAMAADSVDKRYVKEKLIEINGKLDTLIKGK